MVKDLALSPLWLGSLLWREFDPWPGNFSMPWAQSKKKENKKLRTHLLLSTKSPELPTVPDTQEMINICLVST